MSKEFDEPNVAVTPRWGTVCKDCRARRGAGDAASRQAKRKQERLEQEHFDYSDEWATRTLDRGGSRSDRCPECRKTHRDQIRAFPVAYVDIDAIGPAWITDPEIGPTGPLGGLGPLPNRHQRTAEPVSLKQFELGLNDNDILRLLERLAKSQVVVLEAGTGTGKSTLAPFRLMNPPPRAAYRPAELGPIVVTEPRIPATTDVARFVGEAMCFGHDPEKCNKHVGPGFPVGYQCDGKKVWDDACRLIYVTDGTMINWIKSGELARFSVVVIDEAHERSTNIDVILALLREFLPRHPDLKVIIASATISPRFFIEYFSGVAIVDHQPADAGKRIGYGVPLFAGPEFPGVPEEQLLREGLTIADSDGTDLARFPGWPRDLTNVTRTLLGLRWPAEIDEKRWRNDMPEACASQAFRLIEKIIVDEIPTGDVLVFLPVKQMVLAAQSAFDRMIQDRGWPVTTYWLMRDAPKQQKEAARRTCDPGTYKVVFASNLAETSLTIAGLRYVVDSGLVCQQTWDPQLATHDYPIVVHSRAGARQRWGRVGRKTHGWVYPMYTRDRFVSMPQDTPAGSTQTSLEQSLMALAAAGVDDIETIRLPADHLASSADSAAAEVAARFATERRRAVQALKVNGAMTADGHLTPLGRELERSRFSPERTMALLFADRLACVPEVAVALVALDSGGLVGRDRLLLSAREWPAAWCVQARRCHEALALGCEDDLDLVLRIFREWEEASDSAAWARRWWINNDALETIRQEVETIVERMAPGMGEAGRPINVQLGPRARAVLSRSLVSAHYQRQAGGAWRAVGNAAAQDLVSLPPDHLTRPADHVVALCRERAPMFRGQRANAPALLQGVVNVLDWACEGALDGDGSDAFSLMLRAHQELRDANGELHPVADAFRPIRHTFPIGAALRVRLRQHSGSRWYRLEAARTVREPFGMPDTLPEKPRAAGGAEYDERKTSPSFYTNSRSREGDEAGGDFRTRPPNLAGAEEAPEELATRPRSLLDLETESLGVARIAPAEYVPEAILDHRDRVLQDIASIRAHGSLSLQVGEELTVHVTGYHMLDQTPALILQRVVPGVVDRADPAVHDDVELGEEVDVVAGDLVSTAVGEFRGLHRCDPDGSYNGLGVFWFYGPGLDENDTAPAADVLKGTRWRARIMEWERRHEPQSISLIDDMYSRLSAVIGVSPQSRNATVPSRVSGVVVDHPVVVEDREFLCVAIDLPESLAFRPRLLARVVRGTHPPGTRVSLMIEPRRGAQRSGRWTAEQRDSIVAATENGFVKDKGSHLKIAGSEPLDEARLQRLWFRDDPDSISRAWLLWRTSRHYSGSWNPRLQVIPDEAASEQNIVALPPQVQVTTPQRKLETEAPSEVQRSSEDVIRLRQPPVRTIPEPQGREYARQWRDILTRDRALVAAGLGVLATAGVALFATVGYPYFRDRADAKFLRANAWLPRSVADKCEFTHTGDVPTLICRHEGATLVVHRYRSVAEMNQLYRREREMARGASQDAACLLGTHGTWQDVGSESPQGRVLSWRAQSGGRVHWTQANSRLYSQLLAPSRSLKHVCTLWRKLPRRP